MKKNLVDIFNEASREDIDVLLNENIALDDIGGVSTENIKKKTFYKIGIQAKARKKLYFSWKKIIAISACIAIMTVATFASYSCVKEIKTLNDAKDFFSEHNLELEGLSNSEIKAVYKDIITEKFKESKTAWVLKNSFSDYISGVELIPDNPTPEELKKLWEYALFDKDGYLVDKKDGIRYEKVVGNTSMVAKYDGDTLLWSVPIGDFVNEILELDDGVIAYGISEPVITKISSDGEILWQKKNTIDEVYFVLGDRNYSPRRVISLLVDNEGYIDIIFDMWGYLCLARYSPSGEEIYIKPSEKLPSKKWVYEGKEIEQAIVHISSAAFFEDKFLLTVKSSIYGEKEGIMLLDREGNLSEFITFRNDDSYFYVSDVISYQGKIYVSGYSVLKNEYDEVEFPIAHEEFSCISEYIKQNDLHDISKDEVTSLFKKHYSAVLFVCDPKTLTPQSFLSVPSSIGEELKITQDGKLSWNVQSFIEVEYTPSYNFCSFAGKCLVYEYIFDEVQNHVSTTLLDKIAPFKR